MNGFLKSFGWIVALMTLPGCSTNYSSLAVRARVIDAESKLPVANANVVAHWQVTWNELHGQGKRDIEIVETVSDKDGWFLLPAWGPKPLPPGIPSNAYLSGKDPEIYIFKSSYVFKVVSNQYDNPFIQVGGSVRTSQWNNMEIELKLYSGDRSDYAFRTAHTMDNMNFRECAFKKMPLMILALDRESRKMDAEGINNSIPKIETLNRIVERENCGSVSKFFESFK